MGRPAPPESPPEDPPGALDGFGAAARRWFEASFEAPTPVQARGWPLLQAGRHALLLAPTGSGKTLAAFFACLDRLGRLPETAQAGVRVLYVSPLKALVYDIERNLRAPRVGIQRSAEALAEPWRAPRVAVRTGDTPQRERRDQARHPAEILVTTPESLYLILGSAQRETLQSVETVIVDEIHALAPTKRGAHLALSLERVARLCAGGDPQRIGLSATAQPVREIARFLGGDRPVEVVDASEPPRLDLTVSVPVPDMTRPDEGAVPRAPVREGGAYDPLPLPTGAREVPEPDDEGRAADGSLLAELAAREAPELSAGLWPALYPVLLDAIRAHRSTLVFVNSRGLCERLARRLNELADEELVRAHHGSVSHESRREIEEALKAGRLRGLVATSSLELGIDMGAVDLVLLVESPGAVARGLQRVGRAGHRVGETSRGLLLPKHRGDLLEATVVARGMREGAVEAVAVPRSPLDVLAQQIVAMVAVEPWGVDELEACVRRAASYRELSRELLCGVLDMLAGRYPSTDFAELRPRLHWDRERDRLEARRGAGRLALLSGGTIPDRGLYRVHHGPDGPRVGELDEEMVHETRAGEVVTLGASSWRVTGITRDRVIVAPAPGEVGKLPFWRGEGPGRPLELGRALGAFVGELARRCGGAGDGMRAGRDGAERWLREDFRLDAWAARNLVEYVIEQHEATGALPSDRAITIERFRDELGDWRICILTPFGARLHAPWALAIEARLSQEAGFEVQALWSDDGIVLRLADADELPAREALLLEPEEVEDLVVGELDRSPLFAGHFRENAARALLLPRRRPGSRTPLWSQRLRAQNLLAVTREFPSFPVMLETYRSCLQDVFDLPGLVEVLRGIRERRIRVDEVETASASPFARQLVFAWTAAFLYQGDTPVAERRAQALTLDRAMLRDLLGQEDLRELLDGEVIAEVEAELQGRAEGHRARHPDGLHDLLRRVGDLSLAEVAERCEAGGEPAAGAARSWLSRLETERRAAVVKIAGGERWIAAEEAGLYRDALGVAPPAGLPDAFLASAERPFEQLALRFARRRGPFATEELAERYGLVPGQAESGLAALEHRGRLGSGGFRPGGSGREWCHPEVLRQLRRRTLAKLRGEVAPVEDAALGRFLPRWHGIAGAAVDPAPGDGRARLEEAVERLEGVPLAFSELEARVLPARVPGYEARWLDELGALGQVVWVGRGPLGPRDGRVALYRRDRVSILVEPPAPPDELGELPRRLLAHLEERGASFFSDLARAAGPDVSGSEVVDALFDLVWGGLVTNDTFAPLRAAAAPPRRAGSHRRRPPRALRRGEPGPTAGRWSAVSSLLGRDEAPDALATRRAHARALLLLERYGVASREAAAADAVPGGFAALYPVYRAMEESGKLRRGHFVEGLAGAQFAWAGAVDRLRSARASEGEEPEVVVLAATDPANPYGALLPWPPTGGGAARPRRAAGAVVVLVDGEAAVHLERGGARWLCFASGDEARRAERLERAVAALAARFLDRSRRAPRVEEVDGEPAPTSSLAPVLARHGFRREGRALVLDRYAPAGR